MLDCPATWVPIAGCAVSTPLGKVGESGGVAVQAGLVVEALRALGLALD